VGLTEFGRDFVRCLVDKRILVDLSHINRAGFFDALSVMPREVTPIVTHTGVCGVRPLWRNIDDAQLRAIANRGGTIGIVFHPHFLAEVVMTCSLSRIVDHMEHTCRVVGDDFVSIGSDYDGLITLPRDLPDVTYQPRLVAEMLERGWSETRIRKILGGNALRVIAAVRP
jgi:membrane dipeptidase